MARALCFFSDEIGQLSPIGTLGSQTRSPRDATGWKNLQLYESSLGGHARSLN